MATAVSTDHRRAGRRETQAPSTVRAEGMRPIDVTVLDFSATGFRIESSEELSLSSEISIGLPGVGTRRAFVAWRKGNRYGCAFHKAISQEEADRAFTAGGDVVAMGRRHQAVVTKPDAVATALDAAHNHWYLPLDAILAIAGYALLGAYALWRFLT